MQGVKYRSKEVTREQSEKAFGAQSEVSSSNGDDNDDGKAKVVMQKQRLGC
jgi:hypothetical protein